MTFVVSSGSLQRVDRPPSPLPTRLRLADDYTADYAEIWRTQPAVRTVVSFLARNIASLGLHAFRRVSDTDRTRLTGHPIASLIARPNPRTTRYRLFDALIHDLGIFDVAYWAKLAGPALVRLPPQQVTPDGESWLWAESFEFRGSRGKKDFRADQVVQFHGFNPTDARTGCSPIESLRRVLAEEYEAGRMREQTLRNGARASGYIERPLEAPRWDDGRKRFKAEWQAQYAGDGPEAGGTPILEDGMVFKPASQTAEDLQYIQARKLTREEVASAYFIPPPMVGILDHATFSNIEKQHRMLYQDCFGPILTMVAEEIGLQILPELDDSGDVYVEFNLAEKLRGDFEEQAQAAQASTGAPWMTRNEQRARWNLPAVDGGDDLIVPLNVLAGGQASPQDSVPAGELTALDQLNRKTAGLPRRFAKGGEVLPAKARAASTHEAKHLEVLARFFRRQGSTVKSRIGAGGDWWEADRWDRELATDLLALAMQTSTDVAGKVLDRLGFTPGDYDADRTVAFLTAVTGRVAHSVNAVTKSQLDAAVAADDPAAAVGHVFDVAESSRAAQIATTTVTAVSGFASVESAKQVVADPSRVTKTWVTGPNPRPTHAAMSGETVPVDSRFSNGALWPADAALDVDETAGCNCSVEIEVS